MMRRLTVFVLGSLFIVGCQQDHDNTEEFKSLKLSVDLVEADSENEEVLSLAGYSQDGSPAYVTKAALWCEGEQKRVFEFDADKQSEDLFGAIEGCELRLQEFKIGERTFSLSNQYSAGAFEFQSRNDNNRLVDNRLVRSHQQIGPGQLLDCKDKCQFKTVTVTFPFSVLDIRNEILENTVNFSELTVGMQEEDAPVCDSFEARFINGTDFLTPPNLEIKLTNCQNTIGSSNLEFGFDKIRLSNSGNFVGQFLITHAQVLINDLPIVPTKNGNDYTITLSLEEIKALWGRHAPSTVEALTTDFVLAIRNEGGISALLYALKNKCVVKHGRNK
ncbi:MAG: hypothetical protein ACOH5I_09100 [Oligoflexus sp.]